MIGLDGLGYYILIDIVCSGEMVLRDAGVNACNLDLLIESFFLNWQLVEVFVAYVCI